LPISVRPELVEGHSFSLADEEKWRASTGSARTVVGCEEMNPPRLVPLVLLLILVVALIYYLY
jgi:hypothetical protein